MPEPTPAFLWLDMEMTGLDPVQCVPIEVALIVTDANLASLATMESVIWQPPAQLENMVPIVRQMHTDNGLLDKVGAATRGTQEVENDMLAFVAHWFEPRTAILCGNSIHQDRRFIAQHFPALDRYLHYRMVDVSSIKELAKRWYPDGRMPVKRPAAHTALSDVQASIEELKFYRENLFVSGPE